MITEYPFKKYFIRDVKELYNELEDYDFNVVKSKYHLKDQYKYKLFLPPLFRGKPYHIEGHEVPTDDITDYFIEEIRLNVRLGSEKSPLELWEEKRIEIVNKAEDITYESIRKASYNTLTEATTFKPNWARTLIKFIIKDNIEGKRWLDISAGWGDRMIAAMSLNMKYQGYDPNFNLEPYYNEMINTFDTKYKPKIYIEPFETAKINGKFDLILSSPPFFNYEKYSNDKNQSYIKYNSYDNWMVNFLFTSLKKAWDKLEFEGYLILHLSDTKINNLVEPTNIFISEYLSYSNYEGVIGLKGNSKYYRPVWVWKKTVNYKNLNLNMEKLYNNLYNNFFNKLIFEINKNNSNNNIKKEIEIKVSKKEFKKWEIIFKIINNRNNKDFNNFINKYPSIHKQLLNIYNNNLNNIVILIIKCYKF